MKVFRISFGFWKCIILAGFILGVATNAAKATLMPILDVNSSQYTIADLDLTDPGDELKIDYFVKNVSTFTDPGNAFKNIEIDAGTNQGVYEASIPQGWETIFYEDKTRFHTADHLYYIYPDEIEPVLFSLLYSDTTRTLGQSQAMTPLGLWTDPVPVLTANVPEPSTITLVALGTLCLGRRKKINQKE